MKLNSLLDLQKCFPDTSPSSGQTGHMKHDGKGKSVRIALDTKGRKGKVVTVISGLQHNPTTMKDIARMLKEHCGTGGTVKDGVIELRGDQRVRSASKLRDMNYVPSSNH